VHNDLWGLPYRLVNRKLSGKLPIPGISLLGRLQDYFLPGALWSGSCHLKQTFEPITAGDLAEMANSLLHGKGPGLDGVSDTVVKAVILKKPAKIASIFNKCMLNGCFPSAWKEARLILVRKLDKLLELPSSYCPSIMVNTIGKMFERVLKRRLEVHLGLKQESST